MSAIWNCPGFSINSNAHELFVADLFFKFHDYFRINFLNFSLPAKFLNCSIPSLMNFKNSSSVISYDNTEMESIVSLCVQKARERGITTIDVNSAAM